MHSPKFARIILIFLWVLIPLALLLLFSLSMLGKANLTTQTTSYPKAHSNPELPLTPEIKMGEVLYKENCISCHRATTSPIDPGLAAITTHEKVDIAWLQGFLDDPAWYFAHDEYGIYLWNAYGRHPHPAFTELTDQEVEYLWEYFEDYHKRGRR